VGSANAGFVEGGIGSTSEVMVFEVSGLLPTQTVRVGVLGGVHANTGADPLSITLSGPNGPVGRAVNLPTTLGWVYFDLDTDGAYSITATQRSVSGSVSIGGLTFDSIGGPLVVNEDLAITSIVFDDGEVELTWTSEPGRMYTIQTGTDLIGWTDLITFTGAASPATTTTELVDFPEGTAKKFYRVVE